MAYLYGVLSEKDLADQRVTEIGVSIVDDAISQSVAEHNRQIDAITALFVERTTDFKARYLNAAATRNQPLDEAGRARPIKQSGSYDLAWPIQMSGSAFGFNYVTGQKATVREVARTVNTILDGDKRWMRDHFLGALFVDGSWTFTDPIHGALTVKGLASGDSDTYEIINGSDAAATDDHVKGAASLTAAVFADIYSELIEHPENQGAPNPIVFVPTASRSTVEGLTGFYPVVDPNLHYGSGSTIITTQTQINAVAIAGVPVPGRWFGYIDNCWVVEWPAIPSNYLLAVMPSESTKPLRMREDVETSLHGFQEVADRNDYPWYERQYMRRCGFGAFNRVGAVVYETDNSSYSVPANMTSPMP